MFNPLTFWRDLQTFRKTLKEWFGDGGKPVDASVSSVRALQCRGCVFNQHGTRYMDSAAKAFKRLLEAKSKLRLSVLKEGELHTCKLCRCYLPLKIHVPSVHIRSYQREEVRQLIMKDKPDCWQLFRDR